MSYPNQGYPNPGQGYPPNPHYPAPYPQYPPGQPQAYPYGPPVGYPPHPHAGYPPQPHGGPAFYPPAPGHPPQHPAQHFPPAAMHHPHQPGYPPIQAQPPAFPQPDPSDSSIPSDKDWIPTIPESQQIDEWFVYLAEGAPHVGGAKAASFLKGANISVDSLRAIWGLVDSSNKGHVDKVQFTRIIRLVAIAKSPIYAGSAPSMDRYFKTARDNFPLPPLSIATPSSVTAPATVPQVTEPKPLANADWVPSAQEVAIMDGWFSALDLDKSGYVLGARAAMFLQNCSLSRETLRPMWGLVDTTGAGRINKTQFYKIIRLVSLGCFPAHANKPPSMELYYSTTQELIPLPVFNSPKEVAPPPAAVPVVAPLSPNPTAGAGQPSPYFPYNHPTYLPTPGAVPPYQYPVHPGLPGQVYPPQPHPHLSPHGHPAVHVQEEEFSDFTGASNNSATTAPSQIEEDDFSDFTSAVPQSFPNRNELAMQPAIAIVSQAEHKTLNIDDAFSDMAPAIPQAPLPTSFPGPASSFAAASNSSNDGDDEDGMGEFVSATSADTVDIPVINPFAGFSVNVDISDNAQTAIDMMAIGSPYSTSSGLQNSVVTSSLQINTSALNSSDSFERLGNNQDNPLTISTLSSDATAFPHAFSVDTSGTPVSASASIDKMHYFDALAELDVQAATEEWDDFAAADANTDAGAAAASSSYSSIEVEGTQKDLVNPFNNVQSKSMATSEIDWGNDVDDWHTTDPVVASNESSSLPLDEDSDDFGGFKSASNDSPPKSALATTPSIAVASVDPFDSIGPPSPQLASSTNNDSSSNSSSLGMSFAISSSSDEVVQSPAKPTDISFETVPVVANDFASFEPSVETETHSIEQSIASAKSDTIAASDRMSAFDDLLGDLDAPIQPTLEPIAPMSMSMSMDPFSNSSAPVPMSSVLGSSWGVGTTTTNQAAFDADFEDDDFGGFEAAANPSPNPIPSANVNTNTAFDTNSSAFGSEDFNQQPKDSDDFGDFEFVEAHAAEPSAAASTPAIADLVDFDVLVSAPAAPTAAPANPNTSKSIDLFDFDNFSSAPVAVSSSAAVSQQQFAAFDPFGDSSAIAQPPLSKVSSDANASFDPFGSPSQADDDFGDFSGVSSTTATAPAAAPAGAAHAPVPISLSAAGSTTSASKKPAARTFATTGSSKKPLSKAELEDLAKYLFDCYHYEEAYLCSIQAETQAAIQRYSEEKREAVDNDDLETAIKAKNAITRESSKLVSKEEEAKWLALAEKSEIGVPLTDSLDVIVALNAKLGGRCKTRYIDCAPSSSSSTALLERAKFALLARRSMRLITAVLTTHTAQPSLWSRAMTAITSVLTYADSRLQALGKVSSNDKEKILESEKMKTFLSGISIIANLGIWVATSCIECLVNEKQAAQLLQDASKVIDLVKQASANPSKVHEVYATSEDLLLRAGLTAATTETRKAVYCNLTLRPIGFEQEDSFFTLSPKDCNGFSYLKAAANFWEHNFKESIPKPDCRFE